MQQIQIKPGHTNVLIAGHKLASAGDVVTLSDAEYLTLDPALFDVVFTDLGQVGMLAAQVEWGNGSRVAFMGDSITAGGIAAGRFGAYSPAGSRCTRSWPQVAASSVQPKPVRAGTTPRTW